MLFSLKVKKEKWSHAHNEVHGKRVRTEYRISNAIHNTNIFPSFFLFLFFAQKIEVFFFYFPHALCLSDIIFFFFTIWSATLKIIHSQHCQAVTQILVDTNATGWIQDDFKADFYMQRGLIFIPVGNLPYSVQLSWMNSFSLCFNILRRCNKYHSHLLRLKCISYCIISSLT